MGIKLINYDMPHYHKKVILATSRTNFSWELTKQKSWTWWPFICHL